MGELRKKIAERARQLRKEVAQTLTQLVCPSVIRTFNHSSCSLAGRIPASIHSHVSQHVPQPLSRYVAQNRRTNGRTGLVIFSKSTHNHLSLARNLSHFHVLLPEVTCYINYTGKRPQTVWVGLGSRLIFFYNELYVLNTLWGKKNPERSAKSLEKKILQRPCPHPVVSMPWHLPSRSDSVTRLPP